MTQTTFSAASKSQKFMILFCLVFAGEMIFSLPFHIARFFRPTFLDVFALTNSQLGDIFAVYGLTAMLAYFPGGAIADMVSGRKLMTLSLVATAAGGVYLMGAPNAQALLWLFGYWGITTILLFWAAMIKTTRELGGSDMQGRAFGFLDCGRGLMAAAAATGAVTILGVFLPEDLAAVTESERVLAMRQVILFYVVVTASAALLVWFFIPETPRESIQTPNHTIEGMRYVIARPAFWWKALIVVCAYCGYKGVDNYALYAVEVLQMNELEAAQFTSNAAFLRPLCAVAAGFLADRFFSSRVILVGFGLMVVSYGILATSSPQTLSLQLLLANMLISVCGVYAVRGVYFALLEESRLSDKYTGTAVGLISVVGFTPDIFFAPMVGRILDASPGLEGHQDFFAVLTVFSVCGLFLAWVLLMRTLKRHRIEQAIT